MWRGWDGGEEEGDDGLGEEEEAAARSGWEGMLVIVVQYQNS